MTNQKLFNALEICLQALEHGADLESCLALFPALAEDLRPLLTTALQARSGEVTQVPADVARRGKSRVLQAAAEMRENSSAPVVRRWQHGWLANRFFRLGVTTSLVLAFLLSGGTGLVSASSSSLPGDHLYPVKRSWEDVRLMFQTNQTDRLQLEQEFEQERVQEIEELYTANRIAPVNFQGQLQTHSNGDWVVGGLNVSLNGNVTPEANLVPGVTVQVIGEADNGVIKAEQIILVATPAPTATIKASPEDAPTVTLSPTGKPTDAPTAAPTELENTPQPAKNSVLPASNPTNIHRPAATSSENGGDSQDGQ